jgi:hypothetical protein
MLLPFAFFYSTSLSVPILTFVSSTYDTVSLNWTTDDDREVSDYLIEYKQSSGGVWIVFMDGLSPDKDVDVTGLTNSTSYDFRIKAVRYDVQSNYSNIITTTTPSVSFTNGFNIGFN